MLLRPITFRVAGVVPPITVPLALPPTRMPVSTFASVDVPVMSAPTRLPLTIVPLAAARDNDAAVVIAGQDVAGACALPARARGPPDRVAGPGADPHALVVAQARRSGGGPDHVPRDEIAVRRAEPALLDEHAGTAIAGDDVVLDRAARCQHVHAAASVGEIGHAVGTDQAVLQHELALRAHLDPVAPEVGDDEVAQRRGAGHLQAVDVGAGTRPVQPDARHVTVDQDIARRPAAAPTSPRSCAAR